MSFHVRLKMQGHSFLHKLLLNFLFLSVIYNCLIKDAYMHSIWNMNAFLFTTAKIIKWKLAKMNKILNIPSIFGIHISGIDTHSMMHKTMTKYTNWLSGFFDERTVSSNLKSLIFDFCSLNWWLSCTWESRVDMLIPWQSC